MDYPHYDPQLDSPALSDADLEALDTLLQSLPGDSVMNVEALDGYLTALLVGPPVLTRLRTADWLPVVWGGDGVGSLPFSSQKQRKRAAVLVLRQLRDIDRQLQGDATAWQPVFSIAETDDREFVDAEDWCAGFLHASLLDSDAWGALFDDAVLGPLLLPVALLGADESGLTAVDIERLADPAERDALSRAVADGVLALRGRTGSNIGSNIGADLGSDTGSDNGSDNGASPPAPSDS